MDRRAYQRAYQRAYRQRPEVKAAQRAYQQRPEAKAAQRAYQQRPEVLRRTAELLLRRAARKESLGSTDHAAPTGN